MHQRPQLTVRVLLATVACLMPVHGVFAQATGVKAATPARNEPATSDAPGNAELDATMSFITSVSARKVHLVLDKRARRHGIREVGAHPGLAGLGWKWGIATRDLDEMDRLEAMDPTDVHTLVVQAAAAEIALTRWAYSQGMKEADRRLAAILGAVAGEVFRMNETTTDKSFAEAEEQRRQTTESSFRAWKSAREAVQRSLAREPSISDVAAEIDSRWAAAAAAVRATFGDDAGNTADSLLGRHRDSAYLDQVFPEWANKHAKGDTLLSPAEFTPMEKQPSRRVAYGYISDTQPQQFFAFQVKTRRSITLHLRRDASRGASFSLDLLRADAPEDFVEALWPGRGAEGTAGLFVRLGPPGKGKPGPVFGNVERVEMKTGKKIVPAPLNASARKRLEKSDPEELRELELVTYPLTAIVKPGAYVLVVRANDAGPQTSDRFSIELKGNN